MSEPFATASAVQQRFPQWTLGTHAYRGDQTAVIARDGALEVCRWLRDDPALAMNLLMDLSCVDYLAFGKTQKSRPGQVTPSPLPYFMTPAPSKDTWPGRAGAAHRFEVVYHLYSTAKNHRLRLKVPVDAADPAVDSVTPVWKAANWYEREVWDMFGVAFAGHPDLRRILLYEGFKGHALRKDYPVTKRQPLIGPVNQGPNAPKVPIIVGMD